MCFGHFANSSIAFLPVQAPVPSPCLLICLPTSPHLSSPTNHLSLLHPQGYKSCLPPHLLFWTVCVCVCVCVCVMHIHIGHPMCMNGLNEGLCKSVALVHFLCVCVNITWMQLWIYHSRLPSQRHWSASAKDLVCVCLLYGCAER